MCLNRLRNFQPCNIGYQVKMKTSTGRYGAIYRHDLFNKVLTPSNTDKRTRLVIGETYKAHSRMMGEYNHRYISGFHVFHDLEDARAFKKRLEFMQDARHLTIVKVKAEGKKTTGIQEVVVKHKNGKFSTKNCRVTVSAVMTILNEVE
jgi:hypothetical protein